MNIYIYIHTYIHIDRYTMHKRIYHYISIYTYTYNHIYNVIQNYANIWVSHTDLPQTCRELAKNQRLQLEMNFIPEWPVDDSVHLDLCLEHPKSCELLDEKRKNSSTVKSDDHQSSVADVLCLHEQSSAGSPFPVEVQYVVQLNFNQNSAETPQNMRRT